MIRWLRDYGRVVFGLVALLGSFAALLVGSLIVGPWWVLLVTLVLIVAIARFLWSTYQTARRIGESL